MSPADQFQNYSEVGVKPCWLDIAAQYVESRFNHGWISSHNNRRNVGSPCITGSDIGNLRSSR